MPSRSLWSEPLAIEVGPISFREEIRARVAARVPFALFVFSAIVLVSGVFDALAFPERIPLLFAVDSFLAISVLLSLWAVKRRPERSVTIMVAFVNAAALAFIYYHAAAHANAEWCLLVVTALLSTMTVVFPWGWRAQFWACSSAIVAFPIALFAGMPTVLPIRSALTYFASMVAISSLGSELVQSYLRKDFRLTRTLHEREARLQTYLEQALIGIAILNPAERILEVNDELCHMLGLSRSALLTTRWADVCRPDDPVFADRRRRAIADRAADGYVLEAQLVRPDGRSTNTIVSTRCLRSDAGVPDRFVVMVQDITERKLMEARLTQANESLEDAYRSKSEFLANVSHELRTPMNIIFGMTEMALDSDTQGEQREYIVRTRAAASALLELVNDVLDLSRIEAGRLDLVPREFALRSWLPDTVEPFAAIAREKGIEVSWHVHSDVPEVLIGDPDRLRQVIVNLLVNGIKFTERGRVQVAVETDAFSSEVAVLQFGIADTGMGIPPTEQQSIFDPYVQGSWARRGAAGGTGLGLAICARLVEMMGGRIWVESEMGQGSCFRFTASLGIASRGQNLHDHVYRT